MPERPDIEVYLAALRRTVVGHAIRSTLVASPFLVRTFDPPLDVVDGRSIRDVTRLGKRIVFDLDDEFFAVLHLMIAGRLRWTDKADAKPPGKIGLAAIRFDHGTLLLTEASQKKRASLHVVKGEATLAEHRPAGLDVLAINTPTFTARLREHNHTLKRALTDPRLFDGIGNAYSDEILHAGRLSPVKLTTKLTDEEAARLHAACCDVLQVWTDRLLQEFAEKFPGPGDITAFRPDFAAHGKFGEPCPTCGTNIQRIVYADRETNYCPRCQTGGKLLADRSLSRLLKKDWPKTVEELEGT